jgi:aspartate racemase
MNRPASPLHIGVLAHSADGAALCFLKMVREGARRLGAHQHPEITLSILPMAPALRWYAAGDLARVRDYLAVTARRLADAGCDFFVCPDNTAHQALEVPGPPLPLPGLHLAQIVAARARAGGRSVVGLLGTRWTMEGPVYPRAFSEVGLRLRVPIEPDRAIVDDLIFRELCQGVVSDSARAEFVRIIRGLQAEGCDAVALSCTELPLVITPELSPLPTLDSTRLLAHAGLSAALERRIPDWYGGPLDPVEDEARGRTAVRVAATDADPLVERR